MSPSLRFLPIGLLALLTSSAAPLASQWLDVRRGPGLIRLDTRGGMSQVEGTPNEGGPALRFDERLQLQFMGWILHPRVLNFTTSVSPTFGQHTARLADGLGRGQTTAFDVQGILFPRRRVSVTARTARTSGFNAASLGARSEWVGRSTNLGLNIKDRYFPIRITYGTSDGASSWRNTLVRDPFQAQRTAETFQAEVNNPKLTVRYRSERIRDEGYSDEGRRLNTTLLFDHRLRWGHGSTLNSTYQLQDREGFAATRNRAWNETLSLRHTESVRSRWEFRSRSWIGEQLRYGARNFAGRFLYEPRPTLSASFTARHRSASSSNGTREAGYQFMPQLSLEGGLPWRGIGRITVAGGFDRFTTRQSADDTWIGVVEERHRVDSSLRFLLENYRVDPSSVQVWNDDLSVLFVDGLDYIRLAIGDQVEVQVLPGGRIQEGEIVLVNYRYAALEGRRSSGAFFNATGSADFGWMALRAGHSQRGGGDGDVTSLGDPGFRETRLSVDFRPGTTRFGVLAISLRRDLRRVLGRSTVNDQARADLTLPRSLPLDLVIRTTLGRLRTDGLAASRSLSNSIRSGWSPGRNTTLAVTTSYVVWDREGAPLEHFFAMNGSLGWRWREVIVQASADQSRRYNEILAVGTRWSLSVIRQF